MQAPFSYMDNKSVASAVLLCLYKICYVNS